MVSTYVVAGDWEKSVMQVIQPELHKWWPSKRPVKIKHNNVGAEAHWTDLETGSTLEIVSNNQDPDLHEGWYGDLLAFDEPPRRQIRIANARGLTDRLGKELFCMTLLKEAWVNTEVIRAKEPDGKPSKRIFNVHTEIYDNLGYGITQEGVDDFASKLTDSEKRIRLLGIPSYMEGLVYPDFSSSYKNKGGHIVERFKVPLNWIVDIGIDVHPRERNAVLFVATSERSERYACDEIWDHGDGTAIGSEIIKKILWNGYRVGRIIIDPLAKADGNADAELGNIGKTTFEKIATILALHNYVLEVGSKAKDSGIQEVTTHLKGPNNEPSIWFFDDLIRTLFEIENYMWDKETQKAMKENDHMMENLYRVLLLNTKYEPPKERYEDPEPEIINTRWAVH